MTRTTIGISSAVIACPVLLARAAAPISVMILDGESAGTYHDWCEVKR